MESSRQSPSMTDNRRQYPLVSVNVLCTNEKEHLKICLKHLKEQIYPNIEITVIDNNSHDGSAEYVRSRFPEVKLIENPTNYYYCKSHNIGIEQSRGDYILPMNSDVFLTPSFISELVRSLENDPSAGQAQGKLLQAGDPPGFIPDEEYIDTTGILVIRSRRNFDRGQEEPDIGQYDFPELIFGADGSAPLYRKKMLDDISSSHDGEVFVSDFLIYREVVDVSWRAAGRGWKALYVPTARGYHVRGFSPKTRKKQSRFFKYLSYRNRYVILLRNDTLKALLPDLGPFLWFEIRMAAYVLLKERHLIKAVKDIITRLPRTLKERKKILSTRKRDNRNIMRFFV